MAIVLTKRLRLAIVCTVVWLIIIFVVALNDAKQGYSFQTTSFWSELLVIGVLPSLVLWGIIWISMAPGRRQQK